MTAMFEFDDAGELAQPGAWEGRSFVISSEEAAYMVRAAWAGRGEHKQRAEQLRNGEAVTTYKNPTPEQLEEWAQAHDAAADVMAVLCERMRARLEGDPLPPFPANTPPWLAGSNSHLIEREPR
jgi:hypothetical protein